MHGYIVSRALTLSAGGQNKYLQPAANFDLPTIEDVTIAAQKEIQLLHLALQKSFPEEPVGTLLRVLPAQWYRRLPGLPVILGAGAYDNPAENCPADCLLSQLQALRAAHTERQHYRILIINAFGSNLGDTLIGQTAFRHVLKVLRAELPAVSIDIMLGWHKSDSLQRLFRNLDGIDTFLTQGQSLAELSRYQAVFDTSSLINLPFYGKMPMVDWYLWWMGVDPSTVPSESKRNAVAIPDDARVAVATLLPPHSGPRILINPKASVALRSLSEAATLRLVHHIVTSWPQAQVILLQPLPLKHARVCILSDATPTIDHLAALVAQVDGVIGVDTYTQHLADATATPSVTLFSSFDPALYPYYPLNEAVQIPGARELPAWGKVKVSPAQWDTMAYAYETAWLSLDLSRVLDRLHAAMERKSNGGESFLGPLFPRANPPGPLTKTVSVGESTLEIPLHQRVDPRAEILNRTITALAEQIIGTGDTVAILGAGAGEAALPLAAAVGIHGRLKAFEPRRELYQLLCANLAVAGIRHAECHAVMPDGASFAVKTINRLRIDDEYGPLDLANSAEREQVVCWPFDVLQLNTCRLLVVSAPLPLLSVLQGARETIGRLSPVVLAGVLRLQDAAVLEDFFSAFDYRVRILELGDASGGDKAPVYGILVAEAGKRG